MQAVLAAALQVTPLVDNMRVLGEGKSVIDVSVNRFHQNIVFFCP